MGVFKKIMEGGFDLEVYVSRAELLKVVGGGEGASKGAVIPLLIYTLSLPASAGSQGDGTGSWWPDGST